MPRHGRRRQYTREEVIAVFCAPGLQKIIAYEHGMSRAEVSYIKRGERYGDWTADYRGVSMVNAILITLACTGEP